LPVELDGSFSRTEILSGGHEAMSKPKHHHVEFTAHKTVKEPTEVQFKTKTGQAIDFVANKPVKEPVDVSFWAKGKK
jgi:hypothetical protein